MTLSNCRAGTSRTLGLGGETLGVHGVIMAELLVNWDMTLAERVGQPLVTRTDCLTFHIRQGP